MRDTLKHLICHGHTFSAHSSICEGSQCQGAGPNAASHQVHRKTGDQCNLTQNIARSHRFGACKPVAVLVQYCTVLMGPEGLSVRWEIDSKTLQSSIFLRPEVRFLWLHAVQTQ